MFIDLSKTKDQHCGNCEVRSMCDNTEKGYCFQFIPEDKERIKLTAKIEHRTKCKDLRSYFANV